MRNSISAEIRKLVSLPSTFIALGIAVVGTLGIAALTASSLRGKLASGNTESLVDTSTIDIGFDVMPVGTVGAILLGVTIVSSEYTAGNSDVGGGRQILTSLACVPRRGRLLAAKAIALALVTGILAAVTISATTLLSQAFLGEYGHPLGRLVDELGWRAVGCVVYWVFTALIAFAITVLTRSGVIPLIVLIANTTLVSVTFLLTKVTSWAKFLPDVAGAQMFTVGYPAEQMLAPVPAGVTMCAWTVGLLVLAGTVFVRRDA
ncbi:ABC transporter permease [Actinosynnema sp. CS-041913]|uniref:ABC transporter permease n=1 Tax=Actinosynnema sp. CS-041913 TaxID=3239917 RepID=UPI003D8B13F8